MPVSAGIAIVGMGMSASQSSKAQKDAERARNQQQQEIAKARAEGEGLIAKAEAKRKPYEQMVQDYLFTNKADVKTANTLQRQASAQQRAIDRSLATSYSPGLAAGAQRGIGFNLGNALTSAQIQEDVNRRNMGMQLSQQVDPFLQARLSLSGQQSQGMQSLYAQDYSTNMGLAQAGAEGVAAGFQSLAKLDYSKFGGMGNKTTTTGTSPTTTTPTPITTPKT